MSEYYIPEWLYNSALITHFIVELILMYWIIKLKKKVELKEAEKQ